MRHLLFAAVCALAVIPAAGVSMAETQGGAPVAFSGLKGEAGKPVEITADVLEVSQKDNQAIFKGNVQAVQGDLRLSSDLLTVEYVEGDRTKIDRLIADGNVLLSTPVEAAKAEHGIYFLATRELELTGNVVLTQNGDVMTGQKLTVDIDAGTGRMDGRVKTILQPAGN
ncbi:lipopolysaccharide transport periplasmic protein LptA [Frigidibacter sp. RF13]|uniref:lipopolysaccharide transport periplasmic protein LptA n=1 Tax=Frigidibacter sp. RF13 TaxID=2997340 RepID=UPI00226DDC67|nr:lipopolysaccharide transport periplasmic protein LptA [Frigidibacter sp. RF13]MCY1128408.1 lipopolysaccharide transport periplasmic protein LptA [Frigidibacter sp. RF13]